MKRIALLFALCLAGCKQHHDELRAIQSILDRQLADQQAIADNLNEQRKAIDELDQKVSAGLREVPAAEPAVLELRKKYVASSPPSPTFPTLPPEGSFEGSEGARMRRQIADTEARIMQLTKVLAEVKKISAAQAQMKQELEIIESMRGAPK